MFLNVKIPCNMFDVFYNKRGQKNSSLLEQGMEKLCHDEALKPEIYLDME